MNEKPGVKAFCIHGHFYQPPREDPITGQIPLEPGAAPFRNWNERIHDQCYQPNAELGNFSHISFNIGPTLAQWMSETHPDNLAQIVAQDQENFQKFGVGNAMAQSYNHTIMPLALRHDKITQVRWGICDFENRFGHAPMGMWLPETAVDLESLEVMAECGIEYTILAPWQADTDRLDASQPYMVDLPNGKQMTVFFYNRDLSTRISFDPGATSNADSFAVQVLMPQFNTTKKGINTSQLLLIASDGEVYGHHQPFRDKFLSYLMTGAIENKPVEKTYPALWLKQHPARKKIGIREATSWSCHHGVTRWMGDCDCTPNSTWKAPLRLALNEIASLIDSTYLKLLKPYQVEDPWELRHRYIEVFWKKLSLDDLLQQLISPNLSDREKLMFERLLAAQFERQRMFTSCGWFFDDFDRIEPRNNVAYAAQAAWLSYLASGVDISSRAKTWLKSVKSWRSGLSADVVFSHHQERAHFRWQEDQNK
jgi:hypothetical protein